MKFHLIDKIEELTDERIVAVKYVTLAEEYLADHFPTFPVLPGVLMLEAATQAAGWLLHHRTAFAYSICVLKEARNVKYGQFVAPGHFLRVDAELVKMTPGGASFKASGAVGPAASAATAQAIQLRLDLVCFNLADRNPELAGIDQRLREHNSGRWNLIGGPFTRDWKNHGLIA